MCDIHRRDIPCLMLVQDKVNFLHTNFNSLYMPFFPSTNGWSAVLFGGNFARFNFITQAEFVRGQDQRVNQASKTEAGGALADSVF